MGLGKSRICGIIDTKKSVEGKVIYLTRVREIPKGDRRKDNECYPSIYARSDCINHSLLKLSDFSKIQENVKTEEDDSDKYIVVFKECMYGYKLLSIRKDNGIDDHLLDDEKERSYDFRLFYDYTFAEQYS